MSRGGVKSFAGLAEAVGEKSSIDGAKAASSIIPRAGQSRSVPLRDLVGNPHNPRDTLGNLQELASIAEHQLQPVVVVTKNAYQQLYPDTAVDARWVVIIGNRRLAAAHKFGRPELDIVIKDELAKDRATLLTAVIAENVDRSGFDVIEEARAVESLVGEYGSADAAADHLHKSKTWVSQRRALLKLAPELQEATRRGDLAIREARDLARVPLEQQVARWRSSQPESGSADKSGEGALTSEENQSDRREERGEASASQIRTVTRALRRFEADPHALAAALHSHLGDVGSRVLAAQLRKLVKQ
ncbi:peptide transporter [Mycolicibacterium aromaticivorans JS19b1 = JCM 16368]|uniref:Peptide transporter n=1 Tax=Mycolicibacterium aromaticivorans JS19b1 = JCM 16368 TaxID=1440774 RepID=A0A064CDN1_9MYCO|nr:ParB/RepB/Spo0J family partition protein [Mycolicibacterium aromaticivorans]KDE96852.1 peptide transporter [Mycolicibacterium aromaticivorans JS19b1 = JCM 16368]